uniref:Regulator of chromosome condensation protein n=1 Tax=Pithovirus LCPAC202 TaxID=2506592 RepID=A0A481Z5H0_9VIRU|nr:MAG: regulator of chromosome condensation protein [Pithovirus LCPAC202]
MYVMGDNRNGQLGTDNYTYPFQETPRKLTLPTKISSISAGEYSSIAITKNGQLYIWGRSSDVIPDLKNQGEILKRLPHRMDADVRDVVILKPIIINLDISGDSDLDDLNVDKYKIVYISVGPVFGLAVTKDGYLDVFGADYLL